MKKYPGIPSERGEEKKNKKQKKKKKKKHLCCGNGKIARGIAGYKWIDGGMNKESNIRI